MRNLLTLAVGVITVIVLFVLLAAHLTKSESSSTAGPTPPAQQATAATPEPTASPWDVTTEKNAVTGEQKITADDSVGKTAIVIRQSGKKLEAYIATDEFLETVDNEDSRDVPVIYRIDGGKPIHQTWSLSADNTAVFYRGDVRAFLNRLHSAKEFDIQIPVSDKEPIVLTFDVHGLPDVFPARR